MSRFDDSLAYLKQQAMRLTGSMRDAAFEPLNDLRFQNGWGSSPGTDHSHHAYPGGLVVHTAEVLNYALMADAAANAKWPELILATIYHDCAKIREYTNIGAKTTYRSIIRHVAGSYAEWVYQAEIRRKIDQAFVDAVGHCILAHHGRYEWGSPVEPQTPEALLLHQADMWSAKYGPGRDGI